MISSVAGRVAPPLSSVYAASKFAMEGYSDALRLEMSDFDISVSVVEPGFVKTAIFNSSAQASEQLIASSASSSASSSSSSSPSSSSSALSSSTSSEVEATPPPLSIEALYPYRFDKERNEKRWKALEKADEPTVTTAAIIHAIFHKYPKTRYPVAHVNAGLSATVVIWLRWALSDRVFDMIVNALGK